MRLLIAISFLSLISCGSKSRTNELIGEWICVSTSIGSGIIFNFKSDSDLIVTAIGTDSTREIHYTFNKETGELIFEHLGQSKSIGRIDKLTIDWLSLSTQDPTRLNFLRIKDIEHKIEKEDLIEEFKNSTWVIKQGIDRIRMDFLSTRRWDQNNQPLEAMFHYDYSIPKKEKEIWNIGEYKGKLFMFYTNYQSIQITQQIIEINHDRIVLLPHPYDSSQLQTFERTKSQGNKLINKLTSKSWKSFHQSTTFTEERGQVFSEGENFDILEMESLVKTIEFSFNTNNSYSISISDKEWRKGIWKTSSDGGYVIIDDARDKMNWLQLREENQNIILSKLQRIKDGDRDYKVYMLTMKLEQ